MHARGILGAALVAGALMAGTLIATDADPARADCGEPCGEVDSRSANVQVEVLIGGRPAVVYRDGPYRWIEGRSGQQFAFRIVNRNRFPVGVIPSADGQSLTSDGRAGAKNPAYVIGPHDSLTVSVWREDLRGGRELIFTDIARSLAARKGDKRNIGVLGVCVWELADREPPRPVPVVPRDTEGKRHSEGAAPSASSDELDRRPDAGGIGVGAGDRVTDNAFLTDRYRRVRVLDTVAIYYDDRQGLERAGVDLNQYRRLSPDRRSADPFPDGGYRGVRIPD